MKHVIYIYSLESHSIFMTSLWSGFYNPSLIVEEASFQEA